MIAELGQSGLDAGKRVIAPMAGMQWNIKHELLDGQPVLPRIVGGQQPSTDGRRHPLGFADGHS